MTLSIVIPVYNEKKTILEILKRLEVVNFGCDYEIIIIDDCSTDGTAALLKSEILNPKSETNSKFQILNSKIRIFFQNKNSGKGAALRRGFQEASGEIIVVQDADLEYNPQDLPKLIQLILEGKTDIVYGSRFLIKQKAKYKIFYWGNRLIAFLFFLFYGQKITDPWTCYKVFKKSITQNLKLESNGFEMELEMTAKFLRRGYKILELPISYRSRTYTEGKKIKWIDGIKAIFTIIKYKFHD
ncbi:MAG: glycosyltransferase family 2 protein [Patescibacteria group bacterium]|nr:glycosyltransferase family 2 protein [Patescibacteria group bacterium]MDD5534435.1 glycosyltransferase family 2 protein [Patescibacteria group bacterium]